LRGYGYDTARYWEIASRGSALFSQELPLIIPNNFVDGESALFFSNKEQFKNKFKKYVAKSDEWKEIGRAAHKLFYKHHTPEKRVREQILNQINI
jgi:spore maturation protein CgeB